MPRKPVSPDAERCVRSVYSFAFAKEFTQRIGTQHKFTGYSPGANSQRRGVNAKGLIVGFASHSLDQYRDTAIVFPCPAPLPVR
jgi:hypothetical protein